MLLKIAKVVGILAAGALSGILASAGRRRSPDVLRVRIWADEPYKSNVLGTALVRKNGNVWTGGDQGGFSVDEIEVKE